MEELKAGKWQCLIWVVERSFWQLCGEQTGGRYEGEGGRLGGHCPSKRQKDQSPGGGLGQNGEKGIDRQERQRVELSGLSDDWEEGVSSSQMSILGGQEGAR